MVYAEQGRFWELRTLHTMLKSSFERGVKSQLSNTMILRSLLPVGEKKIRKSR